MKKKIVAAIIASVLGLVPMIAFASSYSTSYYFKYQVNGRSNGQVYSMSAGNITVSQNSSTDYLVGQPQTYNQSLIIEGFFSDTTIGTVAVPINGYDSNTWTNLNSGTYYLFCSKRDDGAYTTASGTITN